jgi:uncharacterized protein (DUF2141 family)
MPATYEPITTQTLVSAQASITLNSISSAYTDLVLVINGIKSGSGSSDIFWQANGDTASNYSQTSMYGTGSSAASDRSTNGTSARGGRIGADQSVSTFNFQNYSNSTTWKTCLSRGNSAGNLVIVNVGVWRSTSAITSIVLTVADASNFNTGTVVTIYGIKAA